jgi:acetylornithine deacetylase/succinyl-diaminopimelate desuccinylase-like protein
LAARDAGAPSEPHDEHMRSADDDRSAPWTHAADEVIERLPRLHDRFADYLAELVAVPAVSARGGDLSAAAETLARVMRDCGLDVSVEQTSGAPVVLGSSRFDPDLPTVLVYGHYDVQPAEPLDAWHTSPFDVTVTDGHFVGRGTADNKAQHLAQLMAIRAILDTSDRLPVNVHMIVEGGEEIGSPDLGPWLLRHAPRLGADVVYTSDGALHPSGRPVVVCGARGLAYVDVTLTVADSDRHSGNFSGVARNAAQELLRALDTLWDSEGRTRVAGFADDVVAYDAGYRAIAELPLDPAMLRAPGISAGIGSAHQWFERVLLQPSLNLSGFSAGWTGPKMKTIIPGSARAKLDARLVPDQSPERVAALLRHHLQTVCGDIEVELTAGMQPSRTSLELPYVSTIVEAVTHGWGSRPYLYPNLAGSLPDAVFTEQLGLPSVIVPYGNADQRNHAPNENMAIANFHAGARTMVCVLHALRHAFRSGH